MLTLLLCSQCALPPGTAWTVIREDGFREYLAISWGKKPVPDYVKERVPEAFGLPSKSEDEESVAETDAGSADGAPESGGALALEAPVEPPFPPIPPELPFESTVSPLRAVGPNPLLTSLTNPAEFDTVSIPEFDVTPLPDPPPVDLSPAPAMAPQVPAPPLASLAKAPASSASSVSQPAVPAGPPAPADDSKKGSPAVAANPARPEPTTSVVEAPGGREALLRQPFPGTAASPPEKPAVAQGEAESPAAVSSASKSPVPEPPKAGATPKTAAAASPPSLPPTQAPPLPSTQAAPVANLAEAAARPKVSAKDTAKEQDSRLNGPPPSNEATPIKDKDAREAALAALPYAVPVPGRPGFVLSPFAQSHQLVDVTGIKAGEAVLCPFSGRFFRTPAAVEPVSLAPQATFDSAGGSESAVQP